MFNPCSSYCIKMRMFLILAFLVSCSTTSGLPNKDHLSNIKSISLMTPQVEVLQQEIAPGPTPYESPMAEWGERAKKNIVRGLIKQFGKRFVIKPLDPNQPADALLSVSAYDEVKTAGRRAMDTIALPYGSFLLPFLNAAVVPIMLVAKPQTAIADIKDFNRNMLKAMWPAGLTKVKIELTDPRTGDILWSFNRESRGGYDLRDFPSVDGLAAEAFDDLSRIISMANTSD